LWGKSRAFAFLSGCTGLLVCVIEKERDFLLKIDKKLAEQQMFFQNACKEAFNMI